MEVEVLRFQALMSVELLAFPNHRNVAGGQRQPDHVRDATHITDNIMIIYFSGSLVSSRSISS